MLPFWILHFLITCCTMLLTCMCVCIYIYNDPHVILQRSLQSESLKQRFQRFQRLQRFQQHIVYQHTRWMDPAVFLQCLNISWVITHDLPYMVFTIHNGGCANLKNSAAWKYWLSHILYHIFISIHKKIGRAHV